MTLGNNFCLSCNWLFVTNIFKILLLPLCGQIQNEKDAWCVRQASSCPPHGFASPLGENAFGYGGRGPRKFSPCEIVRGVQLALLASSPKRPRSPTLHDWPDA